MSYAEHVRYTLMFSHRFIHDERHLGKNLSGFIHKNRRVLIIWRGPLHTLQNCKKIENQQNTMPQTVRLWPSHGDKASAISRMLQPSFLIRENLPNTWHRERVEGLVLVGQSFSGGEDGESRNRRIHNASWIFTKQGNLCHQEDGAYHRIRPQIRTFLFGEKLPWLLHNFSSVATWGEDRQVSRQGRRRDSPDHPPFRKSWDHCGGGWHFHAQMWGDRSQ